MNNRKDHEQLVAKRTRFIMNNINNNNSNGSSHSHDVTVPSSLMSHLQNQSLFNPQAHSNGFPFWSSDEIINNNDHHHHQLSLDLSAMTLLDEDHHQHHQQHSQPSNVNNMARIRGNNNNNNNLVESFTNMPRFWESHAYNNNNNNNNVVDDETVTLTHPRYQNMGGGGGSPKASTFGVSQNPQGLVSENIKWGMQKGHTFSGISQMGSSIDLGNNVPYGHGVCYGRGRGRVVPVQLQNPSFSSPYNPYEQHVVYPSPRGSSFGMENDLGSWDVTTNPIMYTTTPNVNNVPSTPLYYPPNRGLQQLPQSLYPTRPIEEPVAFKCDNSFIFQENDMKNECNNSLLGGSVVGPGGRKFSVSHSQEGVIPQVSHLPSRSENSSRSFVFDDDDVQQNLMNFGSCLPELQSYMFHMAKDQNGGRFLQGMVEKGTVEDMEMVFNGVIDNVVELMMDPFGNYLVQKLLEFCRDDQRLQIVLMLTKVPGQLVRTSFNTHG